MSCGAQTEANELMTQLMQGEDIEIPDIDLNAPEFTLPSTNIRDPIPRLKLSDLTIKQVDGTGAFDVVMTSLKMHLREEYEKSRITGAEYTKAYIAMVDSALQNATQFLLQKDQAYWAAQLAQITAITASVTLAAVKADYVAKRAEALTAKATYALTKLKLASESAQYCLLKDELEVLRPLQASGLTQDNLGKVFTVANMLPAQLLMIKEQGEAQRAQTLDTRSDGAPVVGSVGKQKDLYTQQIKSYQDDSKVKVAKLFTDSWITQKTIDEGLLPPEQFTNPNVNTILTAVRSNVEI